MDIILCLYRISSKQYFARVFAIRLTIVAELSEINLRHFSYSRATISADILAAVIITIIIFNQPTRVPVINIIFCVVNSRPILFFRSSQNRMGLNGDF